MKVIVLASAKGGSAKTTITASLAVAAELAGNGPAVLVDADPQGSLAQWWNVRAADLPALAPATLAELPAKLKLMSHASALTLRPFKGAPPRTSIAATARLTVGRGLTLQW